MWAKVSTNILCDFVYVFFLGGWGGIGVLRTAAGLGCLGPLGVGWAKVAKGW